MNKVITVIFKGRLEGEEFEYKDEFNNDKEAAEYLQPFEEAYFSGIGKEGKSKLKKLLKRGGTFSKKVDEEFVNLNVTIQYK